MSDPRDIDEDAILKGLSPEELDQLEYELAEMDPEVSALLLTCTSSIVNPVSAAGIRVDYRKWTRVPRNGPIRARLQVSGGAESSTDVSFLPECHAARRPTSARPDQEESDGPV